MELQDLVVLGGLLVVEVLVQVILHLLQLLLVVQVVVVMVVDRMREHRVRPTLVVEVVQEDILPIGMVEDQVDLV
tara:strand:- start:26 stop:250 length:225 start_codon:yes stop_codon:yes gene_type:complete